MTSYILLSGFWTFFRTALSVWMLVCMRIIFKKAGRKGWEAIIPVWNVYTLFKIAGKTSYFWVLIVLPILMAVYFVLSWVVLHGYGDSLIINDILQIFGVALSGCYFIIPIICWLELPYGLTKKFGKSNWFYIGMLFLTPIHFGILTFGDAKYEGIIFNEKYSWKKWLLITLGVSLLVGCCDAGIKYKEYKDFYNFDYDYEISNENNDNRDNSVSIIDTGDIVNIENDDLNNEMSGNISDENKDKIEDNIDSKTDEESNERRVNYNDIKKEDAGYKPTNKKWINDIAKDYKGNIIMGNDFVDETKDGFYSVYTEITKRTLYINDEYNFALMIGPEKIGYTMEISYNDINEPSSIHFINGSGNGVQQTIILPREDCNYIKDGWNNLEFNDDYIFVTDFPSYYDGFTPVRIITDIKDANQKKEIVDKKDYCKLFENVVFTS